MVIYKVLLEIEIYGLKLLKACSWIGWRYQKIINIKRVLLKRKEKKRN